MATKKKKYPPKVLYALFDAEGECAGAGYESEAAAVHDAYGPRFRPSYKVVRYEKKKTKVLNE